jgi:hypothetical protein
VYGIPVGNRIEASQSMKPVRVEPEAKEELAAAAGLYENRREGLGNELIMEVDAVFAAIALDPTRFPLSIGGYPAPSASRSRRAFPVHRGLHRCPFRNPSHRDSPRTTATRILGRSIS